MKIGTLTFQRAENYGAVLQAYALQTFLKSICGGSDVDIIDYCNKAIEWSCNAEHIIQQKSIKNYIKYFLRVGDIKKRNRVFAQFRERKFKLSRSCNQEDFADLAKIYDLIIVGSDQVWNDELIGNDPTFFLGNIEDRAKKASYAISLGMDKYEGEFFLKHKNEIKDFVFLSMREESAVEYIQTAYGRDAELCIDPVFLLGQNEWRQFGGGMTSQKKYILCFILRSDNHEERTVNIARELSKKTGYPVRLLMNQNRFYKFLSLKHIGNPSPEEFVSLIDNAEIVVTNSFHATALSILLHTTFYSDLEVKRNCRIVDLLKTVGLERNGCKNGIAPTSIEVIDWVKVDQRINLSTSSSRDYLGRVIAERKITIDGTKKR